MYRLADKVYSLAAHAFHFLAHPESAVRSSEAEGAVPEQAPGRTKF